MNITDCICKYENVTELELKAHIGSPTTKCTKSLFCIFLNFIDLPDFRSERALYLDQKRLYFAKIA